MEKKAILFGLVQRKKRPAAEAALVIGEGENVNVEASRGKGEGPKETETCTDLGVKADTSLTGKESRVNTVGTVSENCESKMQPDNDDRNMTEKTNDLIDAHGKTSMEVVESVLCGKEEMDTE